MKNKELAKRVKELRNGKGFSQEQLAEKSGLSLRTIQRIENGENEPRGDSLRRLSNAFDVSSEDIIDWTVREDNGFLLSLNLSAFTFIVFPILGILVPLIVWVSKKDKIKNVNDVAKSLLNFQITWTLVLFLGYIALILSTYIKMNSTGDISASVVSSKVFLNLVFIVVMYCYNLLLITINTFRLKNNTEVKYLPKIKFIR